MKFNRSAGRGNVRPRRLTKVRAGLVTAAVGAVFAGVALVGGPAQAAAPAYCPLHDICLWKDTSYNTAGSYSSLIKLGMYIPVLGSWTYSGTSSSGHDSVTSSYNNGATDTGYFYKDENGLGARFTRVAGSGDADFTNGSPGDGSFNDKLDSVYFGQYN